MYNPTKKGSYFPSCCSFGFVFFFFFYLLLQNGPDVDAP